MIDDKKKNQERVRVHIRLRPLSEDEFKSSGKESIIDQIDTTRSTLTIKKDNDKKSFSFDSVFDQSSSQKEIYLKVGKGVVDSVLDGFNATILAYGQTGTGKTHTIIGGPGALKGIIPRCMKAIFRVAHGSQTHSYSIRVGFMQLYMEIFQDLLKPNPNNPIVIREDSEEGVYLSGVNWVDVHSVEDCLVVLNTGDKNRNSGFTSMNANSSRSHAVFMVKLEKRLKQQLEEACEPKSRKTEDNTMTKSTLYLVDLAGSERVSKTKVSGNRLDEAKNINLSLLALGNVIQALSDGKSKYIPFRDSKLTRILEQSLGGNSKTSMIVTIGPSPSNYQETLSSLLFAVRAMKIQNLPKMNVAIDYKALCSKLQSDLDKINDGQNISSIETDKLIAENNSLKAQIEKLTGEKVKLEDLLDRAQKGLDFSYVADSNDEFHKIKKFYRNKLEKQEQEHKRFTQEVDKLLSEQEEKLAQMTARIQELESSNNSLTVDLKKAHDELEQERNDRENMLNELYDLKSKSGNDNINEEVMRILGNMMSSNSIKSNGSSILLSNKFKANSPSPKLVDIEKMKSEFRNGVNSMSPFRNLARDANFEELQSKIKKYDRIINNLEDELIEMAEKYNTECAAHRETQINSTMEVKTVRKQLVKLIKAFKRLEKKTFEEKKYLHEAISKKNLEILSLSPR